MTPQTAISPDARRIWRAARGPVLVGVVVLAVVLVITIVRGGGEDGAVDPDSVAPAGSRAVARLLTGQGVEVIRADSAEAAAGALTAESTLLVTQPNWLMPEQLAALRDKARTTVAISPADDRLAALAPSIRPQGAEPVETRSPGCDFNAAGDARLGGVTYEGPIRCYDGTIVRDGNVTVLGGGALLSNDLLDEDGNAALALRLLGQNQRLVWYLPALSDAADAGGGDQSVYDLVPAGWWFGLGQVAIAVLLFMAWRARRLGPVIAEPLPVVVRAAETTEGRARLYRRGRATGHAADALRRATINRLIPLLGLPSDATPEAVTEGVSARTGRPGTDVHAVLFGPAPTTEQALVQLADALDTLADEVGSH